MPTSRRKREGYYTIGVVSKMYDIHPQTLRLYEKRGLLSPARTEGNTRLYSQKDVETLEFVLTLTNELHVNVAGVEIIVHLREKIRDLQERLASLGHAAPADAAGSTAIIRHPSSRAPLTRIPRRGI
ncbi:MAG: MerR family transcriptional regulator [Acidobacteriota bacterium]